MSLNTRARSAKGIPWLIFWVGFVPAVVGSLGAATPSFLASIIFLISFMVAIELTSLRRRLERLETAHRSQESNDKSA